MSPMSHWMDPNYLLGRQPVVVHDVTAQIPSYDPRPYVPDETSVADAHQMLGSPLPIRTGTVQPHLLGRQSMLVCAGSAHPLMPGWSPLLGRPSSAESGLGVL